MPADFKVLLGMIAVLVIPFALTLRTITGSRALVSDPAASPRGYTWSLSLFIVPLVALVLWQWQRKYNRIQKRAFWWTALLVAGSGILLDVFFGLTFFTFVNRQATLGQTFWGYSFGDGWQKAIPIEELGSTSSGFSPCCWSMCGAMNSGLALTTWTTARVGARANWCRSIQVPPSSAWLCLRQAGYSRNTARTHGMRVFQATSSS